MHWPKTVKDWILPTPAGRMPAPATGLYHYQRETIDGHIRYHLRVEPDGQGMLLAAASEAIRLSPAAAAIAKRLLEGASVSDIADELAVRPEDIDSLRETIDQLGQPSHRYPIFNLTDPVATDRPSSLMAPFQADIVPGPRETTYQLLERLWQSGIPHVRFVDTEDVASSHLIDCVRRAEDIGMIAGVRAGVRTLTGDNTLIELSDAGLDYVVVPWGVSAAMHDEIYGSGEVELLGDILREMRRLEMCPVVEIPLFHQTADALEDELDRLSIWDVENVEVFAIAKSDGNAEDTDGGYAAYESQELRQAATWIEDLAAEHPWQVVWLPTVELPTEMSVQQAARRGPRRQRHLHPRWIRRTNHAATRAERERRQSFAASVAHDLAA